MKAADIAAVGENHLAVAPGMENFLRAVERRGLLMARLALRHDDDAFDVVQDSMFRLVQRYSSRPESEWRPLFYRILRNRITDVRRRRRLTDRLFGWIGRAEDDESDALAEFPAPAHADPAHAVADGQSTQALVAAVQQLPDRQQEAFMLRCWEGLSTEETAAAMGCSEGSVKTHYFRALHALQEQLEEYRP
jgi:RNA polymerase sigma-70 factor, ECF subfamily